MKPVRTHQTAHVGRRPKIPRHNSSTRTDILVAARSIFARQGVSGTSIRMIADAAKVNTAMIYYHFKNKTDMYHAVLRYSFATLDRIWDDEVFKNTVSARVKIQHFVSQIIRFHEANEELRRIISIELAMSEKNCTWLADNFFRHHYEKLLDIFKTGMATGELKKIDLPTAIASLLGMIIQSFIFRPVAEYVAGKPIDLSVEKFGRFVTETFFYGVAVSSERKKKGSA
ncbi:MAG: TetR/AcrR family transcriptional regulator [Nitrospirota bacterium]